jgi:GT2 family glycosyltransferase
MNKETYAITFACYNQVEYTRQCIESMVRHGTPLDRLIVIDNGSQDSTREYLQSIDLGGRIYNKDNLGCGVAWNQGALALQADWTIVMNNDVLVSAGWVENLIQAAIQHDVRVISPSMIEGKLNYDFDALASNASKMMHGAARIGWSHAVCLAIHKSVWLDIGYFQPIPKLLGYEDAMFFNEMAKAGIGSATTGASWLHHYGSITQSAMKRERGLRESDDLAYRYNHRLLQQSWLTRKINKISLKQKLANWKKHEFETYGMTMHGYSRESAITWICLLYTSDAADDM